MDVIAVAASTTTAITFSLFQSNRKT